MTSNSAPPQNSVRLLEADPVARGRLVAALAACGPPVRAFSLLSALLEDLRPGDIGCVVLASETSGLPATDVLPLIRDAAPLLTVIATVPPRDVSAAVEAMKAGAADVLETSAAPEDFATAVTAALAACRHHTQHGGCAAK